ncbi:MAG: sulfite exporter TauE/SafE family protein [Pyrinomonadaceae bacterium]|nr:sulfite exporter TauE/SafE family protein [Pyrinomonadaceae bacterium]
MEILAYIFAAAIGISLGLIGAGGSILTVPVLVYLAGVDPVLATAYSLFVVGTTAFVGGIQNAFRKLVDLKTGILFGIPSIAAVYVTRAWIMPAIPGEFGIGGMLVSKGTALLLLFAGLMVATSVSMIRGGRPAADLEEVGSHVHSHHFGLVLLEGVGVGVLTGLVGAGGGFLIIPALVLLAGLEMKTAVGTSLFIIAMKSLIGFTGDLSAGVLVDWPFLLIFTASSVAGIFAGSHLTKFVDGYKLKKAFGWFVLVMGIYMIVRETMFA